MGAGVLNQISFKRETIWGTPVVPDKSIAVRFAGGIQTNQDVQLLSSVTARLPKNYESMVGNRVHEGDYEFDLFPDYTGYFLLSALGSVVSALKGGETIVFEHTFTEAETKPSLTIEQAIGENVRRYAGSMAEYSNYLTKTEREIKLELTGDTIGVASNNKIVLTIHRAVLTTAETPISEDFNLLTIEFEGLYDTVTTKLLTVVVTNLLSNYN